MVGNIVDVGWATIKSGCLPITAEKASSAWQSFDLEYEEKLPI
jgi:hypothetical protein